MTVISDDDLRKLLVAADGKDFDGRRDTAMIRLMIDTGIRAAELAMDIDPGTGDLDLDLGVAIARQGPPTSAMSVWVEDRPGPRPLPPGPCPSRRG